MDSKATSLITMSATVVILLMGFGTFILKSIDTNYEFLNCAIVVLISGIVLMIIGIIFSLLTFKIQSKTYPIGHKRFFSGDTYDEETVNLFRKAKDDVFYKRMIEEYLSSIKSNTAVNGTKSNMVKISHRLFLTGIFTIPILTVFLVYAMLTSNIIMP